MNALFRLQRFLLDIGSSETIRPQGTGQDRRAMSVRFIYLAAALILSVSLPAAALDKSVQKIITVVAGAKVADEECPTGGKQQMAWTAIGNFLSEEWAATDFDDKVAEMANKLRPKSDEARVKWCFGYKLILLIKLTEIEQTPDYRSNKYIRYHVCTLRNDYLNGPKCIEP